MLGIFTGHEKQFIISIDWTKILVISLRSSIINVFIFIYLVNVALWEVEGPFHPLISWQFWPGLLSAPSTQTAYAHRQRC